MTEKRTSPLSEMLTRCTHEAQDLGLDQITMNVTWFLQLVEGIEEENARTYNRGWNDGLEKAREIGRTVFTPY